MGETTCLMQPFSYTAGISIDAQHQGNPIHALGQSVSFGRFMSESLSWEKWSTFSHNRYVEEAEKFSRPGSVAQKRAFFEAHYKNLAARKAAALLEQNNAAANTAQEPGKEGVIPDHVDQTVGSDSHIADDHREAHAQYSNVVADDRASSSYFQMERSESSNVKEVEPTIETKVLLERSVNVETSNQMVEGAKEVELSLSKQMEKPLSKDFMSDKVDYASTTQKKPAVSSSKSLICGKASKLSSTPTKSAVTVCTRKENNATLLSQEHEIDSVDRRKTTHKSMNFTPVREINRITSSIIWRIDSSRVGSNSGSSKDCPTPSRTPLMVPMPGELKQRLGTPQSEKRRAKTPLHPSAAGSKTVRSKWHFLPTEELKHNDKTRDVLDALYEQTSCSKFMTSSGNKLQSPGLSIPFSFRTEERAARRKKKLEEKFNANQAQKVQLQGTLKEKAETELKRLRQSLCFKARALPDFYKQRVAPNNQPEKVPLHSESPELQRKPTPSKIQQSTLQLTQRSSFKNIDSKQVMQKKSKNPRSLASRLKSTHENASPNI